MLKSKIKFAMTVLGTAFVPLVAQGDQALSSPGYNASSSQQQILPGFVAGEPIQSGQLASAYPASAALICNNGWDLAITANYLYWKPTVDSDLLGILVDQTANATNGLSGKSDYVFQNPGYTSGFKVGLGLTFPALDNWDAYAEYTWYKNSSTASATGTASKAFLLNRLTTFSPSISYATGPLTEEAKIGYQTLDFSLGRSLYLGKFLIGRLGAGLRAQWISQTLARTANQTNLSNAIVANYSLENSQTSWQLGPDFMLDLKWMLGYGLSILTNVHASFLYSSYGVSLQTAGTYSGISNSGVFNKYHNYGTIRPVVESFLGLGWGMYFFDNKFHLDLNLGYDFNVYYDQNLLGSSVIPSNVYLQGLNAALKFDF